MEFSTNELTLAYCMLTGDYNSIVTYELDLVRKTRGVKGLDEEGFSKLLNEFIKDPKDMLANMRNTLYTVRHNPGSDNLSDALRKKRFLRYLDAAISLNIKLDRSAFPPGDTIYNEIPSYVMDGMTDMGKDERVDPTHRRREKIRVDKGEIFSHNMSFLVELFSQKFTPKGFAFEKDIKTYVIKRICKEVYEHMPYNYDDLDIPDAGQRTIRVGELWNTNLAVCRHHALWGQVLFQFLGIGSKLLKCRLNGGSHAVNLVSICNVWYLTDITNPHNGDVYLEEIPDRDIDLNQRDYTWVLDAGKMGLRIYCNNKGRMYYRIRDNDDD